jgi:Tfp pilus assembly protein PilZ
MPDGSLNQRPERRVPVKVTIRISTIDPETDPTTGRPYFRSSEETCSDVSRGGTFVTSHEPIAPGRRLLLELDIPDGPSIQTVGRVAWTRTVVDPSGEKSGSGFGIEFMGGAPEHLSQLEAFLDDSEGAGQSKEAESAGWQAPRAKRRDGA